MILINYLVFKSNSGISCDQSNSWSTPQTSLNYSLNPQRHSDMCAPRQPLSPLYDEPCSPEVNSLDEARALVSGSTGIPHFKASLDSYLIISTFLHLLSFHSFCWLLSPGSRANVCPTLTCFSAPSVPAGPAAPASCLPALHSSDGPAQQEKPGSDQLQGRRSGPRHRDQAGPG